MLTLLPGSWSSPSPGWSLVVLVLLGAVAVAGGGPRLATRERGALAGGTAISVAVFGGAAVLVPTADRAAWLEPEWMMNSYPSTVEAVVALALIVLLAGLAALGRYRDRRWRMAAWTLLVVTGWLLVPSRAGGDARLVLGAVVVLSIGGAVWYLRRVATVGEGARPFAVPATLALGCAAGLAAAALLAPPVAISMCFGEPGDMQRDCQEMYRWIAQGRLAYVAWLVALLAWVALPRRVGRVLVAVAVVATPAVLWPDQVHHPAPDNVAPMTMSALGLVALLGSAGPVRRSERWGVLAVAAATLALPTIVILGIEGAFAFRAVPMFALAFVPLAVALVSGWRAAGRETGSRRLVAAGMVALSGAWLVVLAYDVTVYRIVGVVLVAAALIVALTLRYRPFHDQGVPHAAVTA